jgi:hypothetical protein
LLNNEEILACPTPVVLMLNAKLSEIEQVALVYETTLDRLPIVDLNVPSHQNVLVI